MTTLYLLVMYFATFLLKPSTPSYPVPRQCLYIMSAAVVFPSPTYSLFYEDEPDENEIKIDDGKDENATTTMATTTASPEVIRKRIWMECADKTHVKPELVLLLKDEQKYNWQQRHSPDIKKWGLCVLNAKGLMSNEGVFKMDAARSRISKEDIDLAEDIIDKCLSKKALPPAEIAWNYLMCINEQSRHAAMKINISSISLY